MDNIGHVNLLSFYMIHIFFKGSCVFIAYCYRVRISIQILSRPNATCVVNVNMMFTRCSQTKLISYLSYRIF